MVWEDLKPQTILTASSFRNAIAVDMAIGGSTNAIIHLVALARRLGMELPLKLFDEISQCVPVLADVRPSGRFLMEDFYYAGGLRALMSQIEDLLDLDCRTVNGKTLGANLEGARVLNSEVIRERRAPLMESGGTAILYGNLAPDGAVIKTVAANPRLWQHTGPAVIFSDFQDMEARIDREDLDVDENSVLVLQNAGPQGGPGMPEWGMLPIPKKLLQRGVRDMVRISDARMSGTAYGTCVLHVAPESYIGGPLAHVRTGDLIKLDIPNRRIELLVPDTELQLRRSSWTAPLTAGDRGYLALYRQRVTQANKGCDFDFLSEYQFAPQV
jgi:dihydroxy-acid dehydratase